MKNWIKSLEERGKLDGQLSELKKKKRDGYKPEDLADSSKAIDYILVNSRISPEQTYKEVSDFIALLPPPELCEINLMPNYQTAVKGGHDEAAIGILKYQIQTKSKPDLGELMVDLVTKGSTRSASLLRSELEVGGLLDMDRPWDIIDEHSIPISSLVKHIRDFYLETGQQDGLEKAKALANHYLIIDSSTDNSRINIAQAIYQELGLVEDYVVEFNTRLLRSGKILNIKANSEPLEFIDRPEVDLSIAAEPFLKSGYHNYLQLGADSLTTMLSTTKNKSSIANTLLATTFCGLKEPFVVDISDREPYYVTQLSWRQKDLYSALLTASDINPGSQFERTIAAANINYLDSASQTSKQMSKDPKRDALEILKLTLEKGINPFSIAPEQSVATANFLAYAINSRNLGMFEATLNRCINSDGAEAEKFITEYPQGIAKDEPQTPLEHACVFSKKTIGEFEKSKITDLLLDKIIGLGGDHNGRFAEMIDKAAPQNRHVMVTRIEEKFGKMIAKEVESKLATPLNPDDLETVFIPALNDRFESDETLPVYKGAKSLPKDLDGWIAFEGLSFKAGVTSLKDINIDPESIPKPGVLKPKTLEEESPNAVTDKKPKEPVEVIR